MLKIILNKKKYSFPYNPDVMIKEILKKFCEKKGLLADIYEVYNPKTLTVIDDNKSPNFHNLNKLYLRRVREAIGSADDGMDSIDKLEPSQQSSDISPKNQLHSMHSLDSLDSKNSNKKKRSNFFKKKLKIVLQKGHANSLSAQPQSSTDESIFNTLGEKFPKQYLDRSITVDNKRKRQAPLPPYSFYSNVQTIIEDPEISIPSPPPIEDSDNCVPPFFQWQADVSLMTERYSDMDESPYSSISGSRSPSRTNISKTLSTPLCITSQKPNQIHLNSNCGVINLPEVLPQHVEDNISDSEEHIYAIIQKKITDQSQFSVSKIDNAKTSSHQLNANNSQKPQVEDPDSDCSSVDTPACHSSKTTTIKKRATKPDAVQSSTIYRIVNDSEPKKPVILMAKPQSNVDCQQKEVTSSNEHEEKVDQVKSVILPSKPQAQRSVSSSPPIMSPKPKKEPTPTKPITSSVQTKDDIITVQRPPEINVNGLPGNTSPKYSAPLIQQIKDERPPSIITAHISHEISSSTESLYKNRLKTVHKSQNKSLFFTAK